MIWPLFRKMAANQKLLNQIGIFWYQFTPRKLLYLMISVNMVKFGPHWLYVFFLPPCIYTCKKSLLPKGAKSIFEQNRVTNITTLFSLPPTFRTHFWSEYNEQKEDIVISILISPPPPPIYRRRYKLAQRNVFFSEVTKVDLAPFGSKLFIQN